MAKPRFSIHLKDESGKRYRQYFFLSDSEDIQQRIFNHTFNFVKCSDLPKEDLFPLLNNHLTSLCHKVNMVKYHLKRYATIEDNVLKQLEQDLKSSKFTEGTHFIEMAELTAEYESFLFQVKSALDILVGFFEVFYRKSSKKSLMKKQVSFGNKGLGVIKSIEKYLQRNPEDENYLNDLLEYLKKECSEIPMYKNGSTNWIFCIIEQRDEIAHLFKIEHFAFQVDNIEGKRKIIPPRLTPDQTILESFKVAYENLFIFIEDFIALLLAPYLNDNFVCFTYGTEEIKEGAPRWYIMLSFMQAFGLKSIRDNPYSLSQPIESMELPISVSECIRMHIYYNSFYI